MSIFGTPPDLPEEDEGEKFERHQREAFEAACVVIAVDRYGYAKGDALLKSICERRRDGRYVVEWVEGAWHGWWASREALEIQLPNQFDPIYQEFFDDVDGGCFNYSKYLADVRALLAAAGLKVVS